MITGDNEDSQGYRRSGRWPDHVVAGVLPNGRKLIRELGTLGKVAMVGDGINDDAPARPGQMESPLEPAQML